MRYCSEHMTIPLSERNLSAIAGSRMGSPPAYRLDCTRSAQSLSAANAPCVSYFRASLGMRWVEIGRRGAHRALRGTTVDCVDRDWSPCMSAELALLSSPLSIDRLVNGRMHLYARPQSRPIDKCCRAVQKGKKLSIPAVGLMLRLKALQETVEIYAAIMLSRFYQRSAVVLLAKSLYPVDSAYLTALCLRSGVRTPRYST